MIGVTRLRLLATSLFVLSSASAAFAQATTQPAPQAPAQPTQSVPAQSGTQLQQRPADATPQSTAPTITTFAREVNLIFTVTDKNGRFITGLKQQNFGLLDNGRPPERVINFTQQTNLPLRVGVMMDTSNSIRQRFQFEQDSATEFFLQILHRGDSAFVEGFDVRVDIAQDYTNNIDLLNQAVHKLRPGGGTAFYDALYTTCRDQMLTLKPETAVRRALIIVSDGHDNSSRAQEQDAIKMCQRAETIVYTISTNISPTKDSADDTLKRIADATGGRAFFPNRIEDVANGFHAIQEELRSQYSLQYRPAEFVQDGSFRTIYLVTMDARYKVNARKGYFAPRQ
jgi:VWFA-related protein